MNQRFIDWIWHVRGSLALPPALSRDGAFDRLDPLFHQSGTRRERANDALTFSKKNQAAQDKMSIFDRGTLRIEPGTPGAVLRYHLVSRALLFCFLAPLLFVAIAQLTIAITKFQASPDAASTSGKVGKKDKPAARPVVPMNPIDKFLGAPAPEKPKKDGKEETGGRNKKPSPTPAYVFAGLFAMLYVIGRILEDRLVKRLFQRCLTGELSDQLAPH